MTYRNDNINLSVATGEVALQDTTSLLRLKPTLQISTMFDKQQDSIMKEIQDGKKPLHPLKKRPYLQI
jgi:hypothetical protein